MGSSFLHICSARTHNIGRVVCQGDSGGPIFIENNGELFQVGITSWGVPSNYIGVYADVYNLKQFPLSALSISDLVSEALNSTNDANVKIGVETGYTNIRLLLDLEHTAYEGVTEMRMFKFIIRHEISSIVGEPMTRFNVSDMDYGPILDKVADLEKNEHTIHFIFVTITILPPTSTTKDAKSTSNTLSSLQVANKLKELLADESNYDSHLFLKSFVPGQVLIESLDELTPQRTCSDDDDTRSYIISLSVVCALLLISSSEPDPTQK